MADIADRAQALVDAHLDRAFAAHRAATARPGAGAAECRVCGDPIPPARRVALPGVDTCIDCQAEEERRG